MAVTRARDHLILSGDCAAHGFPKELPTTPLANKTWLGWLLEEAGIWTDGLPDNGGTILDGLVTVLTPTGAQAAAATQPSIETIDEADPVRTDPQDDDPALQSRPLPPRVERISPSRLKDYVNCPVAYKAKHVQSTPEPPRSTAGTDAGALARGTVVHGALELFLGRAFDAAVMEALTVDAGVVPEHRNALVAEARKAVESFSASPSGRAASASPRLMREQRILFPLDRGPGKKPTVIECIIDLLYKDEDGRWCVVDYKTNKVDTENCEERMHGTYGLQMALYQMAVARATGARPEDVKTTVFCTVPGVEVDITADAAALASVEGQVQRVLDAIEREEFDAPEPDERKEHVCVGCPFRKETRCGERRWKFNPAQREIEPEGEDLETSDEGTFGEGV